MVTAYGRRGPSTPLVIVITITLVLTCFLIWFGTLNWFQSHGFPGSEQTQTANPDSASTSDPRFPTFDLGPSPTPIPECMDFQVDVSSALMRECPDQSCQIRFTVNYQHRVCVYGKAEASTDYPLGNEWYVVDINANGAFRDLVYMHESVLKPVNPTPRPTQTLTPLPTITLTPTFTLPPTQVLPTITPLPAEPAEENLPGLPTVTPAQSPTPQRREF
jgi:hypothetical protein